MRAGGRGVLGVYYLLENIIHYYYCQSEGGEDSSQEGETKGYNSPGVLLRGPKKCVEKSNPSESKRKEKLNGACFSCIAHVSREL